MSKYDTITLDALAPEIMGRIGSSLAQSLIQPQTTIFLSGDLGAGKTTLVQGLGLGLGLEETITSPTFALENRYGTALLHMDLYRINQHEAQRLIEETDDFPGVRAVEWSERLRRGEELEEEKNEKIGKYISPSFLSSSASSHSSTSSPPLIHIHLTDPTPDTRIVEITFADIPLPDRTHVEQWRRDMRLPEHIGKHCDAIADFCDRLADRLIRQGTVVRKGALRKAAELHDLLRFVDFDPEVQRKIPHATEADAGTQEHWKMIGEQYPGSHEEACAAFLAKQGYPELGAIIAPHGLVTILEHPEEIRTTEQKLLFYADKRVQYDRIVTLDERFDDFIHRYDNDRESEFNKETRRRTKILEKELFGDDIP